MRRLAWRLTGALVVIAAVILFGRTLHGTVAPSARASRGNILLVTIGANDLNPLESKGPTGCPATCYTPLIERAASEQRNAQS